MTATLACTVAGFKLRQRCKSGLCDAPSCMALPILDSFRQEERGEGKGAALCSLKGQHCQGGLQLVNGATIESKLNSTRKSVQINLIFQANLSRQCH